MGQVSKIRDPARLRSMWEAGVPSAEIAAYFGCRYPAVNAAAKAMGLPSRRQGGVRVGAVCDGLSDGALLSLLDAEEAGRLAGTARVLGVSLDVARAAVDVILALRFPCECRRRENRDGGMAPGWWRAGLGRRA